MDIELLPYPLYDSNVTHRLNQNFQRAEALRACVAFWTIKPTFFSQDFTRLLFQKDSFYCIDINYPTNLDNILGHYLAGATNLYLHLLKAGPSKENPTLPPHLLHAKIMLFDMPGGMAEIWVGSHNLTHRAIVGDNKEASVIVRCERSSVFYLEVNNYLHSVKNECELFDPHQIDFYKTAQNPYKKDEERDRVTVIRLLGYDIYKFSNHTILILGDLEDDLESLRLGTVNSKLILNAVDINVQGRELLFDATVQSTGRIVEGDPLSYGLEFTSRLISIRRQPYYPYQGHLERPFGRDELRGFKYWANIVVGNPIKGAHLEPIRYQANKIWHKEEIRTDMPRHNTKAPEKTRPKQVADQGRPVVEDTEIYRARPPKAQFFLPASAADLTAPSESVDKHLSFQANTIESAMGRAGRENVVGFFKHYIEAPYFDRNRNAKMPGNILPQKGSPEYDQLREFRTNKLGQKMRLIKK